MLFSVAGVYLVFFFNKGLHHFTEQTFIVLGDSKLVVRCYVCDILFLHSPIYRFDYIELPIKVK